MSEMGDIVELEGPHGWFHIAQAGGKPELEHAFLYEDGKHRFFFYADVVVARPTNKFDINIKYATERRFEGLRPRIPHNEQRQIEENIRILFSTRQFYSLKDPIVQPNQCPERVVFGWELRS